MKSSTWDRIALSTLMRTVNNFLAVKFNKYNQQVKARDFNPLFSFCKAAFGIL